MIEPLVRDQLGNAPHADEVQSVIVELITAIPVELKQLPKPERLARWDSLLADGKGAVQEIFSDDKLRCLGLTGSRHMIVSGPVKALARALAEGGAAAQSLDFRVMPNSDVVATAAEAAAS